MMPDYGCFTQSWTNYGIVLPLISHIFGINPDASQKEIEIAPHIPDSWSKDSLSLSALLVADNQISMSYQPVKGGKKYMVVSKDSDWKIRFRLKPDNHFQYIVNGKPIVLADSGLLLLTKKENSIVVLTNK